jgi:hypothetical protein
LISRTEQGLGTGISLAKKTPAPQVGSCLSRIIVARLSAWPRKNPEDRKSYHLRVPLTAAQRQLIEEASGLEEQDLAAWSRTILLEAAKRRIRQAGKAADK